MCPNLVLLESHFLDQQIPPPAEESNQVFLSGNKRQRRNLSDELDSIDENARRSSVTYQLHYTRASTCFAKKKNVRETIQDGEGTWV